MMIKVIFLRIQLVLLALVGSCNEEYRRRYRQSMSLRIVWSLKHLLNLSFSQK